jgi:hypothetical protein
MFVCLFVGVVFLLLHNLNCLGMEFQGYPTGRFCTVLHSDLRIFLACRDNSHTTGRTPASLEPRAIATQLFLQHTANVETVFADSIQWQQFERLE